MTDVLVPTDYQIKIDGSSLFSSNRELMDKLMSFEVEQSLNWPAVATLRFFGEAEIADTALFALSKALVIEISNGNALSAVFNGEITGLEPEFDSEYGTTLVVIAQDKLHKLNHIRQFRAFLNSKDSDIVSQLASAAGLSAEVTATTVVHEIIIQEEETDFAFLQKLAERNGFEIRADDGKLVFKPPAAGASVALKWGESLRRFAPRVSSARQVAIVKVLGWDRAQKRQIVAETTATSSSPINRTGLTDSTLSNKTYLVSNTRVVSQSEAETLAKSILADINSDYLTAEGDAFGNGNIKPGVTLNITGVGTKFAGAYRPSLVKHRYTAEDGLTSHFVVDGVRPKLMAGLIEDSSHSGQRWGGIYPAIVTNVDDPANQGRAKVKLPWQADEVELGWAPVMSVGAGATRGLMWLPEVNDEVLVSFMHGDQHRPYILGGLWNGADAPPQQSADAVVGGAVNLREMKTRTGHILRFIEADKDAMKKGIQIIDATGKFKVIIDASTQKIEIISDKDMDITAKTGAMTITADGAITIESKSGAVNIKGTSAKLEASGTTEIKGATVKVN